MTGSICITDHGRDVLLEHTLDAHNTPQGPVLLYDTITVCIDHVEFCRRGKVVASLALADPLTATFRAGDVLQIERLSGWFAVPTNLLKEIRR